MLLEAPSAPSSVHTHEVRVLSPGQPHLIVQSSGHLSEAMRRFQRLLHVVSRLDRVARKPSRDPQPSPPSHASESAANEVPSRFAAAERQSASVLFFVDEWCAMCLTCHLSEHPPGGGRHGFVFGLDYVQTLVLILPHSLDGEQLAGLLILAAIPTEMPLIVEKT